MCLDFAQANPAIGYGSNLAHKFYAMSRENGFLDFSKKSVFDFFSYFHLPRSDVHAKLVRGVLWIHVHPGLQSVFLF